MPESKLRRIAALAALVLTVVLLALVGGGNAYAAGPKAPKGAKTANGKVTKVGTRARLHESDPGIGPGEDGGPVDPPRDSHFGW